LIKTDKKKQKVTHKNRTCNLRIFVTFHTQ